MIGFDTLGNLVVVAGDYPAPGHMSFVFVQQLVHAMIGQGATISVVAPQSIVHALVHREKLLPRHMTYQTGGGERYDVYRPYILTLGNSRLFSGVIKSLNNFFLSKVLRKIAPNVVYAHFWSSAQLVCSYAKDNSIPVFVACGEGDNALEDMVRNTSRASLQSLSEIVKGVVSVSSENKRKCIEYKLINEDSIGVFPNCVDIELFQRRDRHLSRQMIGAKDDDFVIAFVGGFIPRKGPDRLAQAVSAINDSSIKVMFIGKSFPGYPYDFDCPGILLKGPVDHDKLPDYLSAADVFVLPTQNEGCCNAIVEALALGLPVISSNRPFNNDILDDTNSIKIDPDDVSSITDAILKMRNQPDLCQKMGDVSLSRREHYSVQDRARRILSFIKAGTDRE